MNQFEGNLWVQVYVNHVKEYFDHDTAQQSANEAVKRLRQSDESLIVQSEPELVEGGEVINV